MSSDSPIPSYKVILCGNHQSDQKPTNEYELQTTIAVNLVCHRIVVNGVPYKLQLWDTAGQEAYHSITASYFRSCQGVFLVFDMTDKKSFESLDYWINLIADHAHDPPVIVLIANKNDMPNKEVDLETISAYCRDHDLSFFVTSAVTGENISNATEFMVGKLSEGRRIKATQEVIKPLQPAGQQSCC